MRFCERYTDERYIEFQDARKTVVFTEKNSTYRGSNDKKLDLFGYKVDGGIFKDNVKKCDFALYTSTDSLYLIELKGCDILKAICQINSTLDILSSDNKCKQPERVFARIVPTKATAPNINSTNYCNLKKRIKQLHGDCAIQNRVLKDIIE